MAYATSRMRYWIAAGGILLILAGCHNGWHAPGRQKKIALWNGRDFAGWKCVLLDDTADANEVWQVRRGVIYCTGRVNGYMRTEKTYRDYHLHVEWRWPAKVANSGVFIHTSELDQVWPTCIECQLKAGSAGDLVLMNGAGLTVAGVDRQDTSKRFVMIAKKAPTSEKPAGKWNRYDIYCEGDTVRCFVNGVLQNEGTGAGPSFGYIALQSEGGPIEFRNIYIVSLDTPDKAP
jgi:hypothetical protein